MKKTIVIAILISFNVAVFSQKLGFCEAFGKLIDLSKNSFSDIKGSKKNLPSAFSTYDSKLEIVEASTSEIVEKMSDIEFRAEFGKFKSADEAQARIEEIKKGFTTCYSDFKFNNYIVDILKYKKFNFIQQAEKGLRYYDANLTIENWGSVFTVVFYYPVSKGNMFETEKTIKPTYTDYIYIDKKSDNQQFSNDIRKVITEGKNGFTNFKSDKIESDFYLFENFTSVFNVSGFNECYIEDRGMSIIYYTIPMLKGANFELTQKTFQDYFEKIQTALGTEYAYNVSQNGMNVTFINKNRPEKKVIDILIEVVSEGTFNMKTYIAADVKKQ